MAQILWGVSVIPSDISLTFSNGYSLILQPEVEEGYSVFESTGTGDNKVYGITKYYPFKINTDIISGSTSFKVSAPSKGTATFPLSHGPFITPSLTTYTNQTAFITIAIPSGEDANLFGQLSVTATAPVPQPLTLAPIIQTGQATWQPEFTNKGGLVLRTAVYEVGQKVTGGVGVKLAFGGTVVDTLILDAGVAGW